MGMNSLVYASPSCQLRQQVANIALVQLPADERAETGVEPPKRRFFRSVSHRSRRAAIPASMPTTRLLSPFPVLGDKTPCHEVDVFALEGQSFTKPQAASPKSGYECPVA